MASFVLPHIFVHLCLFRLFLFLSWLKQHFLTGLSLKALTWLILIHTSARVTFLVSSYLFMPSSFRKDLGTSSHRSCYCLAQYLSLPQVQSAQHGVHGLLCSKAHPSHAQLCSQKARASPSAHVTGTLPRPGLSDACRLPGAEAGPRVGPSVAQ